MPGTLNLLLRQILVKPPNPLQTAYLIAITRKINRKPWRTIPLQFAILDI
jgi:hypothetical protein